MKHDRNQIRKECWKHAKRREQQAKHLFCEDPKSAHVYSKNKIEPIDPYSDDLNRFGNDSPRDVRNKARAKFEQQEL